MPYQVQWHTDDLVGMAVVDGSFSEDELIEVSTALRDRFLEGAADTVHLICDATHVTEYPRNVFVIQKASNIYLQHPQMGWLVFIGSNNPFVKFLASTVTQIAGIRFKYAKTLDEAERILKKIDARLIDKAQS